MVRHRFIVSGAFQALNATEAREHFGLDDGECELVFLLPPQPRAEAETTAMIDETGWSRVRVVGPPSASVRQWVQRVRNGRSLIEGSAGLSSLFLGDYQTHLGRHAAHGLDDGGGGDGVVVLDDGMATVRVAAYRAARAEGRRAPRLHPQIARPRYDVQRVLARALGLRLGDLTSVTFFTFYDVTPGPADRVVPNRFEWLRARFGPPDVVDGTLFLGGPLVESGIVSHATYTRLLRRLAEQSGGPLWYRPHPREDAGQVAAVVAEVGAQVLELDSIVEYGLVKSGWVPRRVATTHGTTLDSLRVILGDAVAVQSVALPIHLVARRWRDWIRRAYADMDGRLGRPVERLELL